jgi:hypothetical protein
MHPEIFQKFEIDWSWATTSEKRRMIERLVLGELLCGELGHREAFEFRGAPVTFYVYCARCSKLIRRCTPEEEQRLFGEALDQVPELECLPENGEIEFSATFTR